MWKLDGNIASFTTDPFLIEIDTARPADGIHRISYDGHDLDIRALQISANPPLQDHDEPIEERYVRGRDLITTYKLAASRTARPQVVWTLAVADEVLTLDATIAMQTQLLASDPSLTSATTCNADEALMAVSSGSSISEPSADDFEFRHATDSTEQACGLFLFRLTGERLSYAEMVFPTDFDAGCSHLSDGTLEYRLICEHLEKGVIRKARLRGMLVPRARDTQLATLGYLELRSAAPPLAT